MFTLFYPNVCVLFVKKKMQRRFLLFFRLYFFFNETLPCFDAFGPTNKCYTNTQHIIIIITIIENDHFIFYSLFIVYSSWALSFYYKCVKFNEFPCLFFCSCCWRTHHTQNYIYSNNFISFFFGAKEFTFMRMKCVWRTKKKNNKETEE